MRCSNCGGEKNGSYKELCIACYNYFWRNGIHRRPKSKWCSVCGRVPRKHLEKGMCGACYKYKRRTGKNRPRHLWDRDAVCRNCRKPLSTCRRRSVKGLCSLCYDYRLCYDKDRPSRLWGIGPHGWCECGNAAIRVIEGMPLCKSCLELELS